jgi:ketosteroid isomerase-like protein
MTDLDIQDFVTRFAAAWASRDGDAFLALWHPDGVLHSPLYDRPVLGREPGRLTDIVKERALDSVWQLLDWISRGCVVIVE